MTRSKRAVGHGASARWGSDRRCGVPGLGTNFDSTPPWPWRDSPNVGFPTDGCSASVRNSADRRSRPSDESSASPAKAPPRSSLTYANVGTSRWPTRRRAAGRNLSRSLPAGSSTSRPSEQATRDIDAQLRAELGEAGFSGLFVLLGALERGEQMRMRTYLQRSAGAYAGQLGSFTESTVHSHRRREHFVLGLSASFWRSERSTDGTGCGSSCSCSLSLPVSGLVLWVRHAGGIGGSPNWIPAAPKTEPVPWRRRTPGVPTPGTLGRRWEGARRSTEHDRGPGTDEALRRQTCRRQSQLRCPDRARHGVPRT